MTLSILSWIVLVTIIDGLIALAGAITLIFSKKFFNKILIVLVAFSVGALLGGALLHLIPEALEEINFIEAILLVIIGIIAFLILEKIIHWRHCHEESCRVHPYSYLILYGDAMHNLIDGLLIAGSFLVSIPIGIVTSILVIAHELPQEIGYFGVLVHGGMSKFKALFFNLLSQLTSVIGGIIGYFFLSTVEQYSVYLLPIAAGGFLYIAIEDLIPEVWKEKNTKKRIINLVAIILGFLILLSAKIFAG